MTTEEWEDLACEVAIALKVFDWPRASALCADVARAIRRDPAGAPAPVERLLKRLRRKRQFRPVALIAEALFETGTGSMAAGLQYAQALTDSGYLFAAERFLEWLSQRADAAAAASELTGMRGRIAKQRHVNAPDPLSDRSRAFLDEAVRQYLAGYRLTPEDNVWHGINVVALMERAKRRKIPLGNVPPSDELARSVLSTLKSRQQPGHPATAWELATELEARIALGDSDGAAQAAVRYAASPDSDAFEIESTRRQLEEVWELTDDAPPGLAVLPILRAALLRREGGSVRLDAQSVSCDLSKPAGLGRSGDLEKLFAGQFKNVAWYKEGLRCCESIARIETKLGVQAGTGWLFQAGALFGNGSNDLLLMTNAHVVSAAGGGALKPEHAFAKFELFGFVAGFSAMIWSSPVSEYDATLLKLESLPPHAAGLSLTDGPLTMSGDPGKPHRLYIIGYPGGRGLQFSFDDNVMIACNERRVHYRTPTEGGSSGSPVFEENDWQVAALHHAGKATMPKLDDPTTFYEANEGIPIAAIRAAVRP